MNSPKVKICGISNIEILKALINLNIDFIGFIFYKKTLKTLRKYENEFSKEVSKLPETRRQNVLRKSKIINHILVSTKKSI